MKRKNNESIKQIIIKLNVKNLVQIINEYSISLLNYFTGIRKMEEAFSEKLNLEIRNIILRKLKVHFRFASIQSLYIKNTEFVRRLNT
jgi:hypothetical protein